MTTPANATPEPRASEQQHSSLPWHQEGAHIWSAQGVHLGLMNSLYNSEADARIIEERVNGWDALLKRAEAAEAGLRLLIQFDLDRQAGARQVGADDLRPPCPYCGSIIGAHRNYCPVYMAGQILAAPSEGGGEDAGRVGGAEERGGSCSDFDLRRHDSALAGHGRHVCSGKHPNDCRAMDFVHHTRREQHRGDQRAVAVRGTSVESS